MLIESGVKKQKKREEVSEKFPGRHNKKKKKTLLYI
jgi:hypothetical protein